MGEDRPLVSPEQLALLDWLNEQSEPVSSQDMDDAGAPGYDFMRIEKMRKDGLIDRRHAADRTGHFGVYSISDKGRALLLSAKKADEEIAEKVKERAAQKREKERGRIEDRRFQLFNTLFGIIIGTILTLLVGHWGVLVDWFRSLFR